MPAAVHVEGLALIEDAKQLPLDDLAANPLSAGFRANDSSTRRFVGMPVFARGNVSGRLYLTEETPVRGTDRGRRDRALAGATGIAIDNSRQYEKSRRWRRR